VSLGLAGANVDALELRYLSGTFAELCRIASPSGAERACAERVIAELRALELTVEEDDAGVRTGSDCGNLLVRIPPRAQLGRERSDSSSVLLCAHLDTVPLLAPVEPVLVDGHWQNENEGVLGADNKAAIAVMLALARHVHRAGAPVAVELLFTIGEETALAGAQAFDASRLQSKLGFVFDHASPIGEVVVESPTHYRVEADFHGAAAHAGIRPEQGRSAILAAARAIASLHVGRLDEQTTLNVGTVSGGSAMNVVPERCTFVAEVRSIDEQRAERAVGELVERIHQAANLPECECDVDVTVQRSFSGFQLPASRPALRLAEAALSACGYTPSRIASGGGSDANALIAQGIDVVNLANGTEKNHEPSERVSVEALERMLDVALALLEQAGGSPSDAER
jgi:tripeptide aminopeptidase